MEYFKAVISVTKQIISSLTDSTSWESWPALFVEWSSAARNLTSFWCAFLFCSGHAWMYPFEFFQWVLCHGLLQLMFFVYASTLIYALVISINQYTIQGKAFSWTVVSRRSRFRAGTRLFMRGIDSQGNVANFVETEQIVESNGDKYSFVQVRNTNSFCISCISNSSKLLTHCIFHLCRPEAPFLFSGISYPIWSTSPNQPLLLVRIMPRQQAGTSPLRYSTMVDRSW